MSRYSQYGYYDPVGSQSYQPTSYTYQPPTNSNSATYQSASNSSSYQYAGSSAYANDQYSTSHVQQPSSSASRAAAALSSLSSQNYTQSSSSSRSGAHGAYDNSNWYTPTSTAKTYHSNNAAISNRSQNNNSPLYTGTQNASTFGRLSIPEPSQTQNTSSTFGGSSSYQSAASNVTSNTYQPSYTQPQQSQQPARYNSPFQPAQTQQHGHSKQSSRSSTTHRPSPQMAQAVQTTQHSSRQHSASVEPSPATVDPSQVYDNRAELQRKAQIEAEKRKKYEAEQAAKKAEEERVEAENRKVEEEKQKAEKEAAKKAEAERKKQARAEKKQSKNAAMALQKMTSGASAAAAPANDEESEMRAMFQKMREFNAKNPAMLARLWEEERKSHAEASTAPAETASPANTAAAKAPAKQTSATAASPSAASSSTASNVRPFKKPAEPAKTAKMASTTTAPAQPPSSSPKAAQPQAQIHANSASLWPPHKKGTLAEATAKWLLSQPPNAGIVLNPKAVLNILDGNPSYVQLCESLESMGLKFERSALARELLRAVPDGSKGQPAKPTSPQGANKSPNEQAQKGGVGQRSNSNTVNYEAPLSLSDAARDVNNMNQTAFPATYHGSPTGPGSYFAHPRTGSTSSQPLSQSMQHEVKPEIKPEEPPRAPADKEEAARKRTFGDLVDLTAEDSEEEPPAKKLATSTSAPTNGMNVQQPPGASGQDARHAANLLYKQYAYQPPPQSDPRAAFAAWGTTIPEDGRQKPNGVAHPTTQQPQTLPSQPAHKPRGPSAEQLQQSRLKGKMLVEPIMRDRVARKSHYDSRTIARDVLLATGRHPDMRGLNAHLNAMQKLLSSHGGDADSGGSRADLATVRWDIIDPEPEKVKETSDVEKRPTSSGSGKGVALDDLSARKTMTVEGSPRPSVENQSPVSHGPIGVGAKRRGRPPKYSLLATESKSMLTNGLGETSTPRQSLNPAPTSQAQASTPSSAPTTTAIDRTDDSMSAGKKPVGYSQFNQTVTADDGTVVKKKGRPFGWRKNVHSREAQGLAPATLPNRIKENRPDKPVKTSKKQTTAQVEPQYQVYRCEWKGCKGELHNLETLKKHIISVHGKPSDDEDLYECWWKGCGADLRQEGKVKSFPKIEDWLHHVNKEHLAPIAWKLGDGPRVRDFSSEPGDLPPYLFDKDGRSVTPIISPAPPKQPRATATAAGEDQQDSPPPPPTLPRLGRGRPPKDGVSKAERDLRAPLQSLEQHQRVVGPIMDRMGCVLANEQRRKAFLDDEDFEDEVSGSDYDDGMKF